MPSCLNAAASSSPMGPAPMSATRCDSVTLPLYPDARVILSREDGEGSPASERSARICGGSFAVLRRFAASAVQDDTRRGWTRSFAGQPEVAKNFDLGLDHDVVLEAEEIGQLAHQIVLVVGQLPVGVHHAPHGAD